ncbi:MAG: hypothetical protein JW804_00340 [Sedimentisphaerales bacterium]|nr:hypothetical protein [Sedimentisphaerales bacterium]
MKKLSLLITTALSALLLAGCQPEPQYKAAEPLCTQRTDKQYVMSTAEDVLAKLQFSIDKSDPASGYIRTNPLTGAQSIEFWRKDNIGSFNKNEANLHTIRRTVEMNVIESGGKLCIEPVVTVERMSLPSRDAYSPSQRASMFTRSKGSIQELSLYPQQRAGMEWIELGRDGLLEKEILRRLSIRL